MVNLRRNSPHTTGVRFVYVLIAVAGELFWALFDAHCLARGFFWFDPDQLFLIFKCLLPLCVFSICQSPLWAILYNVNSYVISSSRNRPSETKLATFFFSNKSNVYVQPYLIQQNNTTQRAKILSDNHVVMKDLCTLKPCCPSVFHLQETENLSKYNNKSMLGLQISWILILNSVSELESSCTYV